MIASLLVFVAIVAAVRPSLEHNSKISVSRYDHPHVVAIDPRQNPFLAFFPAPTTMVESEHCTMISVPRAIDSFVWEVTGHYKAAWTGMHTFRMESTQKATIQLGLLPVGVHSPDNEFDRPASDFTTSERSYWLKEGAYYPLQIVYIAGKERVPVKVSTEDGWQDINSQIKHVIYHYQRMGLTGVETQVREYPEPGFHYKAFLFPVHADPELAISNYEQLDLAQEGKFDESFSELYFESITAPSIVEVTGQIVVDKDDRYSLTVSGQVIVVVHVGPGTKQKEKRFFMDKDWQHLDTRVINIAEFGFSAGLYYPYRIAVISDRKDTEWEVKAFDSAGNKVDLFGLWGNQVPEEPARSSREIGAVDEDECPSLGDRSSEYFSCKSNYSNKEREDGVQEISPVNDDPDTGDATHAMLPRNNSEETESTTFFKETSALGTEGSSKSIQEDFVHGETSHDFSSYHPEIDPDDVSDASTEYKDFSYSPLTKLAPTTDENGQGESSQDFRSYHPELYSGDVSDASTEYKNFSCSPLIKEAPKMDDLLLCDDTFSPEDLSTDDEILAVEETPRKLDAGFSSSNQNSANVIRTKGSLSESDSNSGSANEVSSEVVDMKDEELSSEISELSALSSTLSHESPHVLMALGDDGDVISVPDQANSDLSMSDISPTSEISGDESGYSPVVKYANPENSALSSNAFLLSSDTAEDEMTPSEHLEIQIGGSNETNSSEPSFSQVATGAPKPHFDEFTEIAEEGKDGNQMSSEDLPDHLNSSLATSEDTESLGEMSSSHSRNGSNTPDLKQSCGSQIGQSSRRPRVQFSRIPSPIFKSDKYPQRDGLSPEPKNVSLVTPSNEVITIQSADSFGGNEPQAPSPQPRKSLNSGHTFKLGEKPAENEEKPNALDHPSFPTRPKNFSLIVQAQKLNRSVQAKKANVMSQQNSLSRLRWQYMGTRLRQGATSKHNDLGRAEKQKFRSRYVNPNQRTYFSVSEAQKNHPFRGRNTGPKPEEGPKRDSHLKSGMSYQQIKPGDPQIVHSPSASNAKPTPLPRKFVNTQKSDVPGVMDRKRNMNKAPVVAKQQAFATPTQRDSHFSAAKRFSKLSPILEDGQENSQISSISLLSRGSDRAISTYDGAGFKVQPSVVIGMSGLAVVLLAYM